MSNKNLEILSDKFQGKIFFNYSIQKLNWFNIGGKTKVFFKPDNLKDLSIFLKEYGPKKKLLVLGAGSNILLNDNIFEGAVLKLGKNFSNISLLPNNIIVAGAASTDKKLSDFAYSNGVGGFEFLSCIPGTVGGGININSGCYGKEFKDILISIQLMGRDGRIRTVPASDIKYSYRSSNLSKNYIYLSASFKGTKKDKDKIKKEMEFLKKKKDTTQPSRIKTGGSTFKNPIKQTSEKVWTLIKKSVVLDKTFGDAAISEKHSNFLINKGNATSDDMRKLIQYIKTEVKQKTGISLETEIEIIE